MLRSPSTSGQAKRSCFIRPVSGNARGSSAAGATGPKSKVSAGPVRSHHLREADAAEAGVPRLHRRKGKGGGHRGIRRAPARIEHGNARLGGGTDLGNNHPGPPPRRRLAEVPALGAMLRGEGGGCVARRHDHVLRRMAAGRQPPAITPRPQERAPAQGGVRQSARCRCRSRTRRTGFVRRLCPDRKKVRK